jgi:hypothetical protein
MASPEEAYQGLFRGAARLGVLCAGLEVPYETVVPYVGSFSERLKDYFELSIDPVGCSLGIMTRGEGQPFAYRVTRFMEENGVEERGLRRFLVRAKVFEYKNIFFKVEVDARGMREFSTYFRRRPTLDVAHACLADSGVDSDGVGLMEAVAEVLKKDTVHFVATAASRQGGLMEKVYFSQPEGLDSWDRVRAAAALCDLSDADWAPLDAHRDELQGRTTFVSLGYANGVLVPGLKIDIHGVDPLVVRTLLGDAEQRHRADLARASSGDLRHSYVGFRLSPGQPLGIKTYQLG